MVAWDLSGVALAHLPYVLQLLGFFLQSTLREACCCIWELLGMLGVNGICCPTLSVPHPAQVGTTLASLCDVLQAQQIFQASKCHCACNKGKIHLFTQAGDG